MCRDQGIPGGFKALMVFSGRGNYKMLLPTARGHYRVQSEEAQHCKAMLTILLLPTTHSTSEFLGRSRRLLQCMSHGHVFAKWQDVGWGGRKPSFGFHGERDVLTHTEDDVFKTDKWLRCWMGEK